jgi:perosamine synthetase
MDRIGNPRFSGNELAYVKEALERGLKPAPAGTMKDRLERAFAQRFGMPYAVSANSGTSPIHQALIALGIRPGDEIVTTPLAPAMPAFAILQAGAVPIFADVDPDTFLIDPADIERKLTPRTRAILVVHLYGAVCDMAAIMAIARARGLAVVEDCAQCLLGSDGDGRLAGTIGEAGTFSFDNKKHLSSGEGGMLVCRDPGLAERARRFGGLGFGTITAETGNVARALADFQHPEFERHQSFGFNYRLSELAAAVALGQLERIDELVPQRALMAQRFADVIAATGCDWLIPQKLYQKSKSTWWSFAVHYHGEARFGVSWSAFREQFMTAGGDGIYAAWQLAYREPAIARLDRTGEAFAGAGVQLPWAIGMLDGLSCPRAEALQPTLLQFTTNQLSEAERERQAEALGTTIASLSG